MTRTPKKTGTVSLKNGIWFQDKNKNKIVSDKQRYTAGLKNIFKCLENYSVSQIIVWITNNILQFPFAYFIH